MFASLWHSLFLSLKHESSDRKYTCVWVLSWSVVSDSCDLIDCSLLGSSVHGILQASILEWVAISFSRGSARPRNQTQVFCTGGIVFTHWATREAKYVNQHNHVSITFIYKSRFWAGFDLWFSLLTSDLKVLLIKKKKVYGCKWKWLSHIRLFGILQARILEWVAFPFVRGSSQPQVQTQVSLIAGGFFTSWATREAKNTGVGSLSLLQRIFPTHESNWGLLHCRLILYQLSYQGSP